jgi:3-deoxy-D-manno-octulosonic-acid transferase
MDNFRETAALLCQAGGGFEVSTEIELYELLRRWLLAPASCREQGRAAQAALELHRGAVVKSVNLIRDILEKG